MRCFLGLHGVEGVVGAQATRGLVTVQSQVIANLPVQFSIVLDDQYFEHARFLPLFNGFILSHHC